MESVTKESDNSNQIEKTNEVQNGTVKGNSDVLVGETYFDYFEGLGIENIDDYYNNVLFPSVNSDFPQIMPFASWPGGTGDFWTTNGHTPVGVLAMKIGPGFTSWETNNWTTEAIWKDTVLRALQNSFTATNTRINESNNTISALKAMDTHLGNVDNAIKGDVSFLMTYAGNLNNEFQTFKSSQSTWNTARLNTINSLVAENNNRKIDIGELRSGFDSLVNITNGLTAENNNRKIDIGELQSGFANLAAFDRNTKIDIGELQSGFANLAAFDKNIKTDVTSLFKSVTNLENLRGEDNEKNQASFNALSKFENEQYKRNDDLDNRLKKIEGFDFGSVIDLTVLVTAINSVGSKVEKLVDLFNVTKIEPGTFTFFLQGSIKTQTDAIIQALAMIDESLNNNFINYFDDSINGKFWKAFKKFDDFQMAVFFEVFFENYRMEIDELWLNMLENWNTTNGYLDSSYNALVIITQWLKQIYEKPGTPAIVNVPPFDYERLEKILEKISIDPGEEGEGWFGKLMRKLLEEIVKGGFSLLETAITTLGGIIETAIKEAAEFYKVIADFLDGLLDKLIGLIVPKNLDFMRTGFDDITLKFNLKFDSFLSIATDVTNMFKPIPKSVVDELSFDFMGVQFVPKLSLLDSFVPKFRNVMALMLWFQTGWWAFRRFTGTGDVVNDS